MGEATARLRGLRYGAALLGVALLLGAGPDPAGSRLLEGLDYGAPGSDPPSLDLYLPQPSHEAPPLLVFVHSRFWDREDNGDRLAQFFARPLQRAGSAVAVVRHRSAPENAHPGPARDIAAAVAFLIANAQRFGVDAGRIVLAGRESGAHLAALVALDPRYLAEHGRAPTDLRGVATFSGLYDLDPGKDALEAEQRERYATLFGGRKARRAASPSRRTRADAPIFLALAAQQDAPGANAAAAAFATALRDAGHPAAESLVLGGRSHFTQLDLHAESSPARRHLLTLLGIDETFGSIEDVIAARRLWRDPTHSTAGFWEHPSDVTTHDADESFLRTANLLFDKPGRPRLLRPRRYHAIDLFRFLERRAEESGERGDFLMLRNVRGEEVVWTLDALRPYEPVIVVGLDDERELFRLTDFYHTLRRYTWSQPEAEPWVMARPLGAFVHFRRPAPPEIDPGLFGRFGLTPDGFHRSQDDPLAPLRTLPEPERALVIEGLRCVSCHGLRGVGARAGHLRARDGALVGGFALALESYPPDAWRRYCFEQAAVAAEVGANAVALGDRAQLLFDLVERERPKDLEAPSGSR